MKSCCNYVVNILTLIMRYICKPNSKFPKRIKRNFSRVPHFSSFSDYSLIIISSGAKCSSLAPGLMKAISGPDGVLRMNKMRFVFCITYLSLFSNGQE